jgi:hypothetical protein
VNIISVYSISFLTVESKMCKATAPPGHASLPASSIATAALLALNGISSKASRGGGRRTLASGDATLIDDLGCVLEPATLGVPRRL